jgi:hypothetical protein
MGGGVLGTNHPIVSYTRVNIWHPISLIVALILAVIMEIMLLRRRKVVKVMCAFPGACLLFPIAGFCAAALRLLDFYLAHSGHRVYWLGYASVAMVGVVFGMLICLVPDLLKIPRGHV